MDGKPIVLVVTNQPIVRRLIAVTLRSTEFSVAAADVGDEALEQVADVHPDVVLLDVAEAPAHGTETIRRLRKGSQQPIIAMSSRSTPTAVAAMLDAGADDFIARPFDASELAARIRSQIRRRGQRLRTGRRSIASCIVDLGSRRVHREGRSLQLGRSEWTLLGLLLANEGHVVFHDELESAAFGPDHRGEVGLLRATVSRLRRKLGIPAWDEGPIRTVRGLGYAFDPDDRFPRSKPARPAATRTRRRRPRSSARKAEDMKRRLPRLTGASAVGG